MVRHRGLADGVGRSGFGGWAGAPHLEEADQDTECGGQLHPGGVSGHMIDCGVQVLQEGLIRVQGFRHTAHHHRHDRKGACRVRACLRGRGHCPTLEPWS